MDIVAQFRRRRLLLRSAVTIFVLFWFVTLVVADLMRSFQVWVIWGLVLFVGYRVLQYIFWRCPSCNYALKAGWGFFEIKFSGTKDHRSFTSKCPNCGVSFDYE